MPENRCDDCFISFPEAELVVRNWKANGHQVVVDYWRDVVERGQVFAGVRFFIEKIGEDDVFVLD